MESLGDWCDIAPWKSRMLLLVHVDYDGCAQAITVTDKRVLVKSFLEPGPRSSGTLLAVWPGQWSSSARTFGPGDAERVALVL